MPGQGLPLFGAQFAETVAGLVIIGWSMSREQFQELMLRALHDWINPRE